MLTLIGLISVALIGLAVVDLYSRQHDTDVKMCVIIRAEWHHIQRLARHEGIRVPARPPPCPAENPLLR